MPNFHSSTLKSHLDTIDLINEPSTVEKKIRETAKSIFETINTTLQPFEDKKIVETIAKAVTTYQNKLRPIQQTDKKGNVTRIQPYTEDKIQSIMEIRSDYEALHDILEHLNTSDTEFTLNHTTDQDIKKLFTSNKSESIDFSTTHIRSADISYQDKYGVIQKQTGDISWLSIDANGKIDSSKVKFIVGGVEITERPISFERKMESTIIFKPHAPVLKDKEDLTINLTKKIKCTIDAPEADVKEVNENNHLWSLTTLGSLSMRGELLWLISHGTHTIPLEIYDPSSKRLRSIDCTMDYAFNTIPYTLSFSNGSTTRKAKWNNWEQLIKDIESNFNTTKWLAWWQVITHGLLHLSDLIYKKAKSLWLSVWAATFTHPEKTSEHKQKKVNIDIIEKNITILQGIANLSSHKNAQIKNLELPRISSLPYNFEFTYNTQTYTLDTKTGMISLWDRSQQLPTYDSKKFYLWLQEFCGGDMDCIVQFVRSLLRSQMTMLRNKEQDIEKKKVGVLYYDKKKDTTYYFWSDPENPTHFVLGEYDSKPTQNTWTNWKSKVWNRWNQAIFTTILDKKSFNRSHLITREYLTSPSSSDTIQTAENLPIMIGLCRNIML